MTSKEQRNLDLTAKMYEATGRGDWDAAAVMLSEDFFATEAPGLPFGGVYRGKRALQELFSKVMGMMDVSGLDIHQMTAGGDWVIVMLDIVARDSDGSDLRLSLCEAMRFRDDGLCCEIKPYYFDATMPARAVAAKQAMA